MVVDVVGAGKIYKTHGRNQARLTDIRYNEIIYDSRTTIGGNDCDVMKMVMFYELFNCFFLIFKTEINISLKNKLILIKINHYVGNFSE